MYGPHHLTDRSLFGLAIVCFAVAGATNTALVAELRSLVAVTVAVAGTYLMARYARRASRRQLALASITLWVGFLVVASVHALGSTSVGSPVVSVAGFPVLGEALTWATLLSAGTATIFLGFREYGANTVADVVDEDVSGH